MVKKPRLGPRNLGQKLRQIRVDLSLSPVEIRRRLGFEDSLLVSRISEYEQGLREPSLILLLAYARVAQVHLEELVDDDLDLPARLPGTAPHREHRRG
jgi:transcriptional regulator with XRE-family HTH domain